MANPVSTANYFMSASAFICFTNLILSQVKCERTFEIDYLNNTFVKDGAAFRYVSGSIHYTRVHPGYWQDRLRKMRSSGLNAVQTLVPWNVHELEPGKFTWEEASDLGRFLTLAQDEDLVVLLRLGPYICAEWEFGGFPAWLLTEDPKMILRTSDPSYIKWVDRWYTQLLNNIKPFLYKNGGPIVMLQIENEYGSYFACDKDYMLFLRNKVISVLGSDVVLYTTDGAVDFYLKCGKVDGVYATVDFGITDDPAAMFKAQRDYEKSGPLVNSEFYTGGLDHWGSKYSVIDTVQVSKSLDLLLSYRPYTNINMYMFIGGTNFGYMNGANQPPYQPVLTSYGNDSPLNEAGDITLKYYAVRDIISKYLPLPSILIPLDTNKTKYGPLEMKFVSTVQDALPYLTPEGPTEVQYPVPMETIKFYKGFILYRHTLMKDYKTLTTLSSLGIRDRAIVMVNAISLGILDRDKITSIYITGCTGQNLDILVENQGRVGYGMDMNFNNKGIIGNISLGGEILTNWLMYPLHTENINASMISALEQQKSSLHYRQPIKSTKSSLMTPSIYSGMIQSLNPEGIQDTYLDPRPFHKGQAFVNNFNLGRYWPLRGPQVRLYVPKPVFLPYPAVNHLYLFELEFAPCSENEPTNDCKVSLTDKPYLDGPNNPDHSKEYLPEFNDPNLHLIH